MSGAIVDIVSEVAETAYLRHGKIDVGLEAVPVADKAKIFKGLVLKASAANGSGIIYVGSYTVSSADCPQQGMPLSAGQAMEIPCDDGSQVWVVGDDTGLILYWMSL
jgi:hypothetical protein